MIDREPALRDALVAELVPAGGNPDPVLVCMAGIPGSGKTTFLMQARDAGMLPLAAYWHDPDRIMEGLPGYAETVRREGGERAHDDYQIQARSIADSVLFPLALGRHVDIVMDMGFARPEILAMARDARAAGYRIETHFVYCDPGTALERCRARDRHVPAALVAERHDFLVHNVHEIVRISDVFQAFDNRRPDAPFAPLSLARLGALLGARGPW